MIKRKVSILFRFCCFLFLLFFVGINLNLAFNSQIKLTEKDKKTIILSILKRTNFEKANNSEIIYLSKRKIPNAIFDELTELDGKKIVYLSDDEIKEKRKFDLSYWTFSLFEVRKDKVEVVFLKIKENGSDSGIGWEYKKYKRKWRGEIKRYFYGII